jgi:DNA-binding CsgD family transcriptional regulator
MAYPITLGLAQPVDELTSKILNKIDAIACVIDIHHQNIVWANNHFINRTGIALPTLYNTPVDELLHFIHPDYRKEAADAINLINSSDANNPGGLIKVWDKNNHWVWILTTWIVHERKNNGQISSILVFAREVDIEKLYRQIASIHQHECEGQQDKIIKILSHRERNVIDLITNGHSDREISQYLGISIHTAKTHRKRIIHKMGLKNSGALIRYAVENGLLTNELQY